VGLFHKRGFAGCTGPDNVSFFRFIVIKKRVVDAVSGEQRGDRVALPKCIKTYDPIL
jgi:hypothetical protein